MMKRKKIVLLPHIPSQVIESEILHRLDLKTLIRCTCVCKQWNSLITSPSFVSYHSTQNFHHCNNTNTNIINNNESLLFQIGHIERNVPIPIRRRRNSIRRRSIISPLNYREIYSLNHDNNDQIDLLYHLELPPIDQLKDDKKSFLKVVGSCNGLVCIADSHFNRFTLWNPTLRRYVLLPKYHIHNLFVQKACLGFGFDSTNNDFKVVKMINHKTRLHEVLVCSFVNKSWKSVSIIDPTIPPCFVNEGKPPIFMNGKLHWICKHKVGHYNFILAFDLAQETFQELLLPPCIRLQSPMASLSVLTKGGLLAISHIHEGLIPSPKLRVWVMKEYGVAASWRMVHMIQHKQLFPKNVMTLRKNGEIIIEMRGGKIVSYNPRTSKMQDLLDRSDQVFIGYHVESLIFLDKAGQEGVISYAKE